MMTNRWVIIRIDAGKPALAVEERDDSGGSDHISYYRYRVLSEEQAEELIDRNLAEEIIDLTNK